jgi:mRNA interferase MazF
MIRKNNNIDTKVIRGGIYLVDLRERVGSEQGGLRPVVVIQNDTGNRFSPTTIICPLTSKNKQMKETHVMLTPDDCGVIMNSTVLCEQITTIDKSRIKSKVGEIRNPQKICDIEEKILISFGINPLKNQQRC